MKGRKPRQDELDIWGHVAKSVTPLDASRTVERIDPQPSADPLPTLKLAPSKPAKTAIRAPDPASALNMDKKMFRQMQKGKLRPDAKLDLHGMTLDRAHARLTQFVLSSHASGKRLLLVVTGKGKHRDEGGPIPVRFGVLRHQVPEWLRLAPLRAVVLQVSQAHQSHGGGGAYYVYLRKSR